MGGMHPGFGYIQVYIISRGVLTEHRGVRLLH